MNGTVVQTNGQYLPNGAYPVQQPGASESRLGRAEANSQHGLAGDTSHSVPYTNGILASPVDIAADHALHNGLEQAPLEILQLIGKDNYLPIASLISRSAQSCWNGLYSLVDQLSAISIPEQSQDPSKASQSYLSNGVLPKNQTKANLDKKDRILNFASDQKANFVKLLVLLQWSKDVDDVSKTIELNFWLNERRRSYWEATHALALLKQDGSNFQIPNPDIKTAGEVLSLGSVPSLPDVIYHPPEKLSSRRILNTLRTLNQVLCTRLALCTALPYQLRKYSVHDGRATFTVPEEFELDLSVMNESPESQFRVVDFRFTFSPTPIIPDNLHSEIEHTANSNIDREGLEGCYNFFHDLTLSQKIAQFHKQALNLARNHWAGHLKVEFLRRVLAVQYWPDRATKKSWIEIGIQSGRSKSALTSQVIPFIGFKWIREGIEVTDMRLDVDLANLSFEALLYQIIARHSGYLLDAMYERLVATPLFASATLSVEQSTSLFDPEDCFLRTQVSRTQNVTSRIDPVTGLLILSPVSEKSDRLQFEVNRRKTLVDDFVPKLLNFRCMVTEADILRCISTTAWQPLSAFKPTLNEVKTILGSSPVRVGFFRQPHWAKEYLLATIHSVNGDRWSLLKQSTSEKPASLSQCQIISSQQFNSEDEISAGYFEELGEYTSGMIVLESNASQLNSIPRNYKFSTMAPFERGCALPRISVELGPGSPNTLDIECLGVDRSSNLSKILVTFSSSAGRGVLERLASSNPDSSIEFSPEQGHIRVTVISPVGEGVIPEILRRVSHLNNLIACVEQIQTLSTMTLSSLSMSAMTIAYRLAQSPELSLRVYFATAEDAPRLEFVPADTNPHVCLAPQLTRLLRDKRNDFAANLSNVLSSLTVTHVLVSHLHQMQQYIPEADASSDKVKKGSIRLHILVRQPTMFALQFFSSETLPRELFGPETHQQLLARFEILPQFQNGKNLWLLRPAIEEFSKYGRLSYSSESLRARIKDEIFARKEPRSEWMCLDTAAACLADKAQFVLDALGKVLSDWVRENARKASEGGVKAEAGKKQTTKPVVTNGNGAPKTSGSAQQPVQMPNGANVQQKARVVSGKQNQGPAKKQEVITLD